MTQASLSPDLSGAIGASPSVDAIEPAREAPESALWVTTLTASSLLLAAVLLLGLLNRNVVTDAPYRGFVFGVTIMIVVLGVGALAYVVAVARRQGLLGSRDPSTQGPASVAPSGLHVVPAVPAEMGRRRRRQLEVERSVRSQQAKAIATATAPPPETRAEAAPTMQSRTVPSRPVAGAAQGPAPVVADRADPRPAPMRVPPVHPAIRMPGPAMRQPRPAAWPAHAPVLRMATSPVMARTYAFTQQVGSATVRLHVPTVHR